MTINNHPIVSHMTINQLRKCGFDFQESCSLILEDGSVLQLETILRIVPGKRMVALAELKQETVIAKIFFSKKNATQHADRERLGTHHLLKMKIPTPELITTLVSQDKTAHILIFRYLHDADNLNTLWEERPSLDILCPVLKQVTQELATQHVLGMMQRDLHFKNFMITPHKVFTIDGGQLTLLAHKLDKETSMKHFALFLSQMGVGFESTQKELFKFYVQLRGWHIKEQDFHDLFFYIREANRMRWQRHQKKIFRESSQFTAITGDHCSGICDRTKTPTALRERLKNPDDFFQNHPHTTLKAGRSSTVIRVAVDGHDWVIKRYNIKHFLHRIKRLFSISRARKSWYHAQKLVLFGIDIPTPIAFIERKKTGIVTTSYFISKYVEGTPLSMQSIETNPAQHNLQLIDAIVVLLKKLRFLEWTHGDLKETNIIIAQDKPVLVDFDGAKEHATISSLRDSTMKDWRRFLRNCSTQLGLAKLVSKKLHDN